MQDHTSKTLIGVGECWEELYFFEGGIHEPLACGNDLSEVPMVPCVPNTKASTLVDPPNTHNGANAVKLQSPPSRSPIGTVSSGEPYSLTHVTYSDKFSLARHAFIASLSQIIEPQTFVDAMQWEIHQMDVHNAFLHGNLHEEVYMKFPPRYRASHDGQVHLGDGLPSYLRHSKVMVLKSLFPITLLFVLRPATQYVVVLVYVNDLIISGDDHSSINQFKAYLHKCFHMKDLGKLEYFLGVEVAHSNTELSYCVHTLSQFMQKPRREHWEAALRVVVRYLKGQLDQGILLWLDSSSQALSNLLEN
ncbi:hypothetical protein L6164_026167 [Bauhinia variegata]|uniref:Uncharacterized protein n=1 Tax=Bauhinia variegata TaxID=167791 RepID=A0ACB9LNV8_BAUVA|nr:hypothetical protein L6164_026167 [Bauhinia variegata]